jgi:hypothetical protein
LENNIQKHDLQPVLIRFVCVYLCIAQMEALDLQLIGEDKRSIERNVKDIQAECKKVTVDKKLLADKMKRTAAHRQKMCLEQTSTVVLENFPCLRIHTFVCMNQCYLL